MARPEAGLWDFLRARMPVGGHYSRIESNETCPGFPDVHYTLEGQSGGMELKCHEFPRSQYPFSDERYGLRKSQKLWIRQELAAGGRVILALQAKQNIYFVEGDYWNSLEEWTIGDLAQYSALSWVRGQSCNVEHLSRFMLHRTSKLELNRSPIRPREVSPR